MTVLPLSGVSAQIGTPLRAQYVLYRYMDPLGEKHGTRKSQEEAPHNDRGDGRSTIITTAISHIVTILTIKVPYNQTAWSLGFKGNFSLSLWNLGLGRLGV